MSADDRDLNSTEVEPSDYLRKRRHASVNDLRERVYRARNRAYDLLATGHDRDVCLDIVRTAIEHYVTELEPLLANTEQGQPYWEDEKIDDVMILPPDDGREYNEDLGYKYPIKGLLGFQSAPKRFSATFTFGDSDLLHGQQLKSRTIEVAMPERVSWTAFRVANQFAYEIGLDIDHKKEIAVEADPF